MVTRMDNDMSSISDLYTKTGRIQFIILFNLFMFIRFNFFGEAVY